MPLKKAQDYAKKTVEWLSPCCLRIEIAGSIRRECNECHDIDLVCIPKLQKGLNLLRKFLFEYIQRSGGKAHWLDPTLGPGCFGSGPYRENQFLLLLPKCRLDIYCATEENFIVTLIRATGPSEHIFKIEQLAMREKNVSVLRTTPRQSRLEWGRLVVCKSYPLVANGPLPPKKRRF